MNYLTCARGQRRRQRGFVLVTVAVMSIVLFGALGLSVDAGRLYVAKNELQAFTDAAALQAASRLNGRLIGFSNAQAAVAGTLNKWNFNTTAIGTPALDFATGPAGPWIANPATATGYVYARVQASVDVPLYFIRVLTPQSTTTVNARAVGAQINDTGMLRGLGPFTAVVQDPASPNFGFVVGRYYDLQWPQYNGTRAGCGPGNPDKCFVSDPCPGDTHAAKAAVVQYWGANINGYWGASSNSEINAEVLNLVQTQPVEIGDTVSLTNGNKAAEALALDTRVNQDGNVIDNAPLVYSDSSTRNGRRLMGVPVVQPTASGTYVRSFASFLLVTNGSASNFYRSQSGNDPFCAIYVGSYVEGGSDGGGAAGGAYNIKLVE